jgi:hypothetical protein
MLERRLQALPVPSTAPGPSRYFRRSAAGKRRHSFLSDDGTSSPVIPPEDYEIRVTPVKRPRRAAPPAPATAGPSRARARPAARSSRAGAPPTVGNRGKYFTCITIFHFSLIVFS